MSNSENNNEKCVEFFCKTVAELNAITLKQMEGLLNVALIAAKAINAPEKLNNDTKFVGELKSMVEETSQNARNQEEAISNEVKSQISNEAKATFCDEVDIQLINAMENCLGTQQSLNIIGESILSRATTLILSPAVTTD